MDEFIKTLIIQVPNFVGFAVALYIIVKFVVEPNQKMIEHMFDEFVKMQDKLHECCEEDDTSLPE